MGLSDDQRAMLRLVAQRGEDGYDDVAALMGLSVDEVRAKVAEALAALAEEGALASPPEAGQTSQPKAPPEPEQPASPDPVPEPEAQKDPEPARSSPAPSQPETPAKPTPAAPKAARRSSGGPPRIGIPSGNGARAAIAVGALALIAVVVVLIFSGSGDSDSSGSAATSPAAEGAAPAAQEGAGTGSTALTKAVLQPVDGSSSSGLAVFGRVKRTLVLQVVAKGLTPTPSGTEYAICIAASPDKILPIATTPVGSTGKIEANIKLPVELLLYLANETYSEVVITRADTARLKAEIKRQPKEPTYVGTPVLSGKITGPLVGNQKLLEQAQKLAESE